MLKKIVQIVLVAVAAIGSILLAERIITRLYHRWSRRKYTELNYDTQRKPWEN